MQHNGLMEFCDGKPGEIRKIAHFIQTVETEHAPSCLDELLEEYLICQGKNDEHPYDVGSIECDSSPTNEKQNDSYCQILQIPIIQHQNNKSTPIFTEQQQQQQTQQQLQQAQQQQQQQTSVISNITTHRLIRNNAANSQPLQSQYMIQQRSVFTEPWSQPIPNQYRALNNNNINANFKQQTAIYGVGSSSGSGVTKLYTLPEYPSNFNDLALPNDVTSEAAMQQYHMQHTQKNVSITMFPTNNGRMSQVGAQSTLVPS